MEVLTNESPTPMDTLSSPDPLDVCKPWWASQTIWGALVAISGGFGGAYLAFKAMNIEMFMASVACIGGGIHAIVGRFRAKCPVK
jgi:hypothetical protein